MASVRVQKNWPLPPWPRKPKTEKLRTKTPNVRRTRKLSGAWWRQSKRVTSRFDRTLRRWSMYGAIRHGTGALIFAVALCWGCGDRGEVVTETTIQALFDQGLYDRAEGLARAEFERLGRLHGRDARQLLIWSDMLVRALLLNGRGALPSTRALAEHVVEGKLALASSERCCLARSQVNLADALGAA